jgi:hypothetical protein
VSKLIKNRIDEIKDIISILESQNLPNNVNLKQSFDFGINVSLDFIFENFEEISRYLKGDTDELNYK